MKIKKSQYWEAIIIVSMLMTSLGILGLYVSKQDLQTEQYVEVQKALVPDVKTVTTENKIIEYSIDFKSDAQEALSKKMYQGIIVFNRGIKNQMELYLNNSVNDKNKEWAFCLYGYSYDLEQDFHGYFVYNISIGDIIFSNTTAISFECNRIFQGNELLELIGDSHAHIPQRIGTFSPSFEDTAGWQYGHEQYENYVVHCLHNNDLDFACYTWYARPILVNFK